MWSGVEWSGVDERRGSEVKRSPLEVARSRKAARLPHSHCKQIRSVIDPNVKPPGMILFLYSPARPPASLHSLPRDCICCCSEMRSWPP